ncbi:deoxyribodipyrimidine photo-lyase [Vibrio sp. 404]|uniref:Deoxyribodipyrimidine photo-lyase n=1 Tax=Vibrio marinisediminis TaxID=2758441 RepID=A0A7W2FNP9_9VIBR|nr:deoxyribodipyrimidine photo-lyase [Vibrio marinisediminis]MBA5761420.1 deoxyribodipyrimidine photo-lyase [Vibrio marinisediminis]
MHIVWLRRDLRVEDNTALHHAITGGEPVVAVYIATPVTWQQHHLAPIQADLIYRRLFELQADLAKLNIPLLYQQVETFTDSVYWLVKLAADLNASKILLNKEYEWNERCRDQLLTQQAKCEVVSFDDKCLLAPGKVLNQQGDYFKIFTPFKRACLAQLQQTREIAKLQSAKPLGRSDNLPFQFNDSAVFSYSRQSSDDYCVSTKAIRQKLRAFCAESVDGYQTSRDIPSIDGTSGLSPYLAIGALSVRQCLARLQYGQGFPLELGRETWLSELIWRDFYQHLLHFEPKLSKGTNFVAWTQKVTWQNNLELLMAWQQGRTGYPIVDAAMRQLNSTGWMHNRLRMIVASFLTKDLHIHWHEGEKYFMQTLIDGDYAANNGGWQWCASTGCDGQPYFRIFNPTTQGEKFDANGEFVRRWIPELAQVPNKYLHQPWRWENVNTLSYPKPIVDHKTERALTLRFFQDAKDCL